MGVCYPRCSGYKQVADMLTIFRLNETTIMLMKADQINRLSHLPLFLHQVHLLCLFCRSPSALNP